MKKKISIIGFITVIIVLILNFTKLFVFNNYFIGTIFIINVLLLAMNYKTGEK